MGASSAVLTATAASAGVSVVAALSGAVMVSALKAKRQTTNLPASEPVPLQPRAVLLFDIDGVIRDVSGSYRRAIAETVHHFGGWRPEPEQIDALKAEGHWNNDWQASMELLRRQGLQPLPPLNVVVEVFSRLYFGGDPDGDPSGWRGFIRSEPLLVQHGFFQVLEQVGRELDGMVCRSAIPAGGCHGLRARKNGFSNKEVKNMCFSDRLSNHGFWGNFFRLFLSSLAYEMFLLLKKAIRKTKFEAAKKWQISTIRAALLKVGATIKVTKRRVYYRLSKAFVYQDLFREMILQ